MQISVKKHGLTTRIVVIIFIMALMKPAILGAVPESESPADSSQATQISDAQERATAARIRLDELATELGIASENFFEAQEQLEQTEAEISDTEDQLEQNRKELDHANDLLSERAVSAYQSSDPSFVVFVFDSETFPELLARITMVRTIMENDASLIRDVRSLRAEIEANKALLETQQETQQEFAQAAQSEYDTVQQVLDEQQNLLNSLDSEVHQLIEAERARIQEEQIRQAEVEERRLARLAERQQEQENQQAEESTSSNDSAQAGDTSTGNSSSNSGSANSNNNSNSTANNTNRPNNNTNNNSSGNSNAGSGSGTSTPPPSTDIGNLGRARPGVVTEARRFVGVTPYLWGGTTPAGFDCSGLTQWCYRVAYGINLPRTSRQQFHAGTFIPPNRRDLMQPGDLLFYSSTGRPQDIYHVSIFIGGSRKIHAPLPGRFVEEAPAFTRDFIGAVRP